jgi:hypothetical protein
MIAKVLFLFREVGYPEILHVGETVIKPVRFLEASHLPFQLPNATDRLRLEKPRILPLRRLS